MDYGYFDILICKTFITTQHQHSEEVISWDNQIPFVLIQIEWRVCSLPAKSWQVIGSCLNKRQVCIYKLCIAKDWSRTDYNKKCKQSTPILVVFCKAGSMNNSKIFWTNNRANNWKESTSFASGLLTSRIHRLQTAKFWHLNFIILWSYKKRKVESSQLTLRSFFLQIFEWSHKSFSAAFCPQAFSAVFYGNLALLCFCLAENSKAGKQKV